MNRRRRNHWTWQPVCIFKSVASPDDFLLHPRKMRRIFHENWHCCCFRSWPARRASRYITDPANFIYVCMCTYAYILTGFSRAPLNRIPALDMRPITMFTSLLHLSKNIPDPVPWYRRISPAKNGQSKCAYVFQSMPVLATTLLTFPRNRLLIAVAARATQYPCVIRIPLVSGAGIRKAHVFVIEFST